MKTGTLETAEQNFQLLLALGAVGLFITAVILISLIYAVLKSSSELTTIRKILEAREQKENSQKEIVEIK